MEWLNTVLTAIQSNEIVAGLFGTTLLGGILIYLKNAPKQIFEFLLNFFTTTIIVDHQGAQFGYGNINLGFLPIYYKLSSLKRYTLYKSTEISVIEDCMDGFLERANKYNVNGVFPIDSENSVLFSPSQNVYYLAKLDCFWVCFINTIDTTSQLKKNFILKLRFFTRNSEKVNQILYKTVSNVLKNYKEDLNHYRYNERDNWVVFYKEKIFSQPPFLLTETQEKIYSNLAWFLNNKDKFTKIGKPYHTGFVLYGQPGCGKSHFIQKLSEEFEVPVFILNLMEVFSDNILVGLLKDINKPSIILIEDIDRFSTADVTINSRQNPRQEKNNDDKSDLMPNFISMSTILNVLDGVYGTNSGLIFITTTNHIERLDPALIRQGRFDYSYEFKPLNKKEIYNFLMYTYFPNNHNSIELKDDISLPISTVSKICFEVNNIDLCIQQLNRL